MNWKLRIYRRRALRLRRIPIKIGCFGKRDCSSISYQRVSREVAQNLCEYLMPHGEMFKLGGYHSDSRESQISDLAGLFCFRFHGL